MNQKLDFDKEFNLPTLIGRNLLSSFSIYMLLQVIHKESILVEENKTYDVKYLKNQFNFIEKYELFFLEILNLLEKEGFIKINGQSIITTDKICNIKSLMTNIKIQIASQSDITTNFIQPYIKLLEVSSPLIFKVGRGEVPYLQALFPNGNKSYVESIYKTNTQALYYKFILHYSAEIIDKIKQSKQNIKVLEIGAGTGGTTEMLLPLLKEKCDNINYYYTDISAGMLRIGKNQFEKQYNFVNYQLLNIDFDPRGQGFNEYDFDFIICSNVLHATKNIDDTIKNIKSLMSSENSFLLINEIIDKLDFLTITFGLTDGWWLFKDNYRIKYSPIISTRKWKKVLESAHLKVGIDTSQIENISNVTSQNIFIYKT